MFTYLRLWRGYFQHMTHKERTGEIVIHDSKSAVETALFELDNSLRSWRRVVDQEYGGGSVRCCRGKVTVLFYLYNTKSMSQTAQTKPILLSKARRAHYSLPHSWTEAAGILKGKRRVSPLRYQKRARQEWDRRWKKVLQDIRS